MGLFNIILLDSVDSTNSYLKRNYEKLDDLTIVFFFFYTLGSGRMNRKFYSKKGESLLFSILIKNKKIIEQFDSLSLMSGCYIYKFLSKYVSNVSIKWPNDVYINDKKVAGILLEGVSTSSLDALIIGIGININTIDFDEEIKDKATSLRKETNIFYNIDSLRDELVVYLKEMVNDIENGNKDYLNIIKNNNYLKDKEVFATLNNKIEKVKVIDIADDNSLKVMHDNKIYYLREGEVVKVN